MRKCPTLEACDDFLYNALKYISPFSKTAFCDPKHRFSLLQGGIIGIKGNEFDCIVPFFTLSKHLIYEVVDSEQNKNKHVFSFS